jgi:hypothetical protein
MLHHPLILSFSPSEGGEGTICGAAPENFSFNGMAASAEGGPAAKYRKNIVPSPLS